MNFRRLLCFALASATLTSIASTGHAQTVESRYSTRSSSSSPRLIPTVGLTSMKLASDSESTDSDLGLSAGGLLQIGSGHLTLDTGLVYNQFGGKLTLSSGADLKLNLNYLSVPLVGKLNFSGDPSNTAFLKAGLLPSVLVSKEVVAKYQGVTARSNDVEGFKSTDVPVVLGLGGAFPVSLSNSILIEASYVRSLVNISDDSSTKIRNEGFMVNAGLTLEM